MIKWLLISNFYRRGENLKIKPKSRVLIYYTQRYGYKALATKLEKDNGMKNRKKMKGLGNIFQIVMWVN